MMKRYSKGFWGMVFYATLVLALVSLLIVGLLVPAYAAESGCSLPILMYHEIVPDGNELDDYTVSAIQLEADLKALAEEGFQTVCLSEVVRYVHQGTALPSKPVLLVFDDGYRSVISQVIPLLEKYDAKALVSVIGARAQGVADGCDTSEQYMSWEELAEAAAGGRIELQSHSAQLHVYRSRKGLQRLADETEEAYTRMLVADANLMDRWACKAGVTVLKAFAYPYGFVEPLADEILRNQGYEATMTSEPHVNQLSADPNCLYRMGRFNRSGLIDTETVIGWLNE